MVRRTAEQRERTVTSTTRATAGPAGLSGLEKAHAAGLVVLRVVLPLVGFWVATALVGLADYENGLERAVALGVGAVALAVLPSVSWPSRRAMGVALCVLALCLGGYRVHQALDAVDEHRVPTIDIGTTTIAAVELLEQGQSPYTARIDAFGDQVRPGGVGLDHFAGYKYGPVMTLAYGPGVRSSGPSGYFVTSLVALLLLAGAVAWWAGNAGGPPAAAGAAALALSVAFTDNELFRGGVNDVVPMALVVGAFAARSRGQAAAAGVLLGLSFGAKVFPAALLALPLLLAVRTKRPTFVLSAVVVSLAAYLPPLLKDPREVVSNLLLFNLDRPGDRTGLLDGIPEHLRGAAKALLVVGIVLTVLAVARLVPAAADRRAAQALLASLSAVAMALFYGQSPVLHRNWLFWIAPFFAVAIALKAWGSDRDPDVGEPGVSASS